MPSHILIPTAEGGDMAPAMLPVIWAIAHALKAKDLSGPIENSVWLRDPVAASAEP